MNTSFKGIIISILVASVLVSCDHKQRIVQSRTIRVDSLSQIILIKDSLVEPIIYTHIVGLENQPIPETKRLFISIMLPSILIAKYNLKSKYEAIGKLKSKQKWTPADSSYYLELKQLYKANDHDNLLKRMQTLPNSIILAQAVVESGWGQSRFFREGNNVFGMWSYNSDEPRLRASIKRDNGVVHVRAYDNITQSIEGYFKTLSTARAYRHLRNALQQTNNPYELLPHLKYYSEKRLDYIEQLRKVISQNDLTQYDHYRIDPKFLVKQ